jgi:hypothetical protein
MTARFAAINVVTAAITLLSIAVLLPVFGVLGAAIGMLCGAHAGFAMHSASSQRVYHIPIEWRRLAAGLCFTAVAIAAGWMLGAPGAMSLALRTLLFAASSAALITVLCTGEERAIAQRALSSGASSAWSRA